MSQHTPGPWVLDWNIAGGGCLEDHPELQYVNIRSDKYMEIAPDGLSLTGYVLPADAHLIAAAPDLLAAARFVLNYIKNEEGGLGLTLKSGDLLRAAIAKAEGRS